MANDPVQLANSLPEAKEYAIEVYHKPKTGANHFVVDVGGRYAMDAIRSSQDPVPMMEALERVITFVQENQVQIPGVKPVPLRLRVSSTQIDGKFYQSSQIALQTLTGATQQRQADLDVLRNERDADRTQIRDATGRIDQTVAGIAGTTDRIAGDTDRIAASAQILAEKRFDLSQIVTTGDLDGTRLGNLRDVKLTDLTVGQLARLRETRNGQSREFQLLYLDLPRSTREAVARQQRPRYHAPRSQVQAEIDREVLSRQYTDRRTTQRPVRHREADDIVTELPRRIGLGGEIARAGDWSIASSRYDLHSNDRLDYID